MKTRAVLALSAILASGLAAGADAAVKKPKPVPPVCNLIVDPAGDAKGALTQPDDNLDVVSGDFATDAKTATAVIRLKAFSTSTDSGAPAGRSYYFLATVPGATNQIYFNAAVSATGGLTYTWGELVPGTGTSSYTKAGDATGAVMGNELHVSVPLSDLAAKASIKPGVKVSALAINATYRLGVFVSTADDATGAKSYIAGAKSCVTPGK